MTYFWEAREHGFPLLRPLAVQYPADPAAVAEDSVFMLGDELLLVPITSAARTRSFYLPQGSWLDLATNQKHRGRQKLEIPVAADRIPMFLRNGSILPLDGDPMILHYTPSLGAEYFLYEPDLEDYSQMHAAPSLDWMRLEIESKKTRDYEWILHDVNRPKAVEPAAKWRWDGKSRSLHVSVHAAAGSDVIINIRY
jgi:alpha-glucosidase (family GH31 glycosyl hydrolase)